jgi:hypothetical protein
MHLASHNGVGLFFEDGERVLSNGSRVGSYRLDRDVGSVTASRLRNPGGCCGSLHLASLATLTVESAVSLTAAVASYVAVGSRQHALGQVCR